MTSSHPPRRVLPFLHRNWLASINYHDGHHARLTNSDDDQYARPAKRRRFMEGSPDSGIVPDIDALVLHDSPVHIEPAFEINILKISHKDSSRAKASTLPNGNLSFVDKDVVTRARCKIIITTPTSTAEEPQVLYCDSQICNVRTPQDPVGISRMARVYLPQPFSVSEEKIHVERDDEAIFHLADQYMLKVELLSAGDQNWPPLNLISSAVDDNVQIPRYWTLEAEIPNILDRGRRLGVLMLRKEATSSIKTDFFLDIDVRWTTLLPSLSDSQSFNGHHDDYPAIIANGHASKESLPLTNGHANGLSNRYLTNGHAHTIDDDLEDDAEGELTPSRSLRARGSKNYNLKDLSAKAQGREPRKRSKIASFRKSNTEQVTYRLPQEALPLKEVIVDGFSCCVCNAAHQSLSLLRAHLFSHSEYDFDPMHHPTKSGILFDVACIGDDTDVSIHAKDFQLGRPLKHFDLDRYAEGDNSWAISRLGPDNDEDFGVSTQTSLHPKPLGKAIQVPKKIIVPHSTQPLFDPLSKAKLVPGTEIQPLEADETWLIQKHREIVQEFWDVDEAEKEYIQEWDAFIQSKRIASEAFIGRAVVDFVHERADWLLASDTRTREFGKHLTILIARGLDESTVKSVQDRLQEGRIQLSAEKRRGLRTHEVRRETPPKKNGCVVCGKLVRGPGLLICSNEHCLRPLYHDDCIRNVAKMPVDRPQWKCNSCI
ncbi:hypothetical protein BD289DRAFT_370383 [Coniella lustricola]|uniref:Polycomb protein VEFS-Box domain-containing protein n=1 Tax=Coniella lustricola TaxID=2025994 RepID=A0A2T3A5C9_9PEZI|nr:hypothetical protein BD289DRAFT_370383 [Coniella lustricola]